MMVSILDSVRMAEARSCHPDDFWQMKKLQQTAKQHHVHQDTCWTTDEESTMATGEDDILSVASSLPQHHHHHGAVAVVVSERSKLLQTIQQALHEHRQRQSDAQAGIQAHETKAKARNEMGNRQGALLSLKRAARLRTQQAKYNELRIIPQLEMLQTDVEIPSEGAADSTSRYFTALKGEVERVLALSAGVTQAAEEQQAQQERHPPFGVVPSDGEELLLQDDYCASKHCHDAHS